MLRDARAGKVRWASCNRRRAYNKLRDTSGTGDCVGETERKHDNGWETFLRPEVVRQPGGLTGDMRLLMGISGRTEEVSAH